MVLPSLALGSSLVVLAALPAAAQRDFSAVEIESEEVRGGIYMLTGAGGNMGLSVGEDGAYLVDDQFAPLSDKILAAVRSLTDEPLDHPRKELLNVIDAAGGDSRVHLFEIGERRQIPDAP